ncbi:uncharacterized protein NECHADRAFT_88522 [Fusarium vanettenii 77-13-4]|uniref:Uncharacterized protein n=1 Tax=Fusarium vanettenii (strain ATCC MYA-4622 / CBS 123669 / FGSC 9596 / NRRL 45880 / 77-13-4) TaxID=660122 RepID=C7ZBM2_FUSV7|nr:uncharacterized protein NECHADRAFT_88522 [Fusarium vanettenii 77-13-4]EEU38619.1 predicted protein [Fusarium vanettenii 77-13-4]
MHGEESSHSGPPPPKTKELAAEKLTGYGIPSPHRHGTTSEYDSSANNFVFDKSGVLHARRRRIRLRQAQPPRIVKASSSQCPPANTKFCPCGCIRNRQSSTPPGTISYPPHRPQRKLLQGCVLCMQQYPVPEELMSSSTSRPFQSPSLTLPHRQRADSGGGKTSTLARSSIVMATQHATQQS